MGAGGRGSAGAGICKEAPCGAKAEKAREAEAVLNMLIVDDADMERSGIRFLVQKYEMPLQLYEACDGEEALRILGRTHIDILFTDIKMPRMDGIQLATNARMLYPELYIIFCSAYGEFEYAQKAVSLRASCYLLRARAGGGIRKDPYRRRSAVRARAGAHQQRGEAVGKEGHQRAAEPRRADGADRLFSSAGKGRKGRRRPGGRRAGDRGGALRAGPLRGRHRAVPSTFPPGTCAVRLRRRRASA